MSISYSTSRSSLAPSTLTTTPTTEESPALTPPQYSKKHISRRSLTFFSGLPKDFSSLIRSSSHRAATHNQQSPLSQVRSSISDTIPTIRRQTEDPAKLVLTGYAEPTLMTMDFFTPVEKEHQRPSTKSENRLYNFLNRSRSRSRSKPKSIVESSTSADDISVPDLPVKANGHARHSSLNKVDQGGISTTLPGAKPSTRIQSRPLSSTTTATNTTITPPTPTQTRRPKKYPPDLSPTPWGIVQDDHHSGASTPKSSTARQKIQSLFGIPLSPRKSSSTSRPSSPRPSQEVPPLPLPHPFTIHDLTRSPSNPNPAPTHSLFAQNPTPTPPGSQNRASTKGKSRASIPSKLDFFRNQRFFSSSQKSKDLDIPASAPPTGQVPESYFTQPPSVRTPTYSATSSVTSASDQDRSIDNFDATQVPPVPPLPEQITRVASLPQTIQVSRPRPVIPTITHTPPTPQKNLPSSPPRLSGRSDSTDSKRPQGWRPLAMVGEEDARDKAREKERDRERERERERGRVLEREAKERRRWSPRLTSPKLWGGRDSREHGKGEKSRETRERPSGRVVIAITQQPDKLREKPWSGNGSGGSNGVRNGSKHGSFDFEKPIWGKGNGSGASATRSGHSRSGDSLHTGASEHGEKIAARAPEKGSTNLPRHRSGRTPTTSPPPVASTSSHAPSQALTRSGSLSTQGPGASSSLGRVTGKRVPQLTGAGISHGPFAFEPAVPSPTMSETFGVEGQGREHKRDRRHERESGRAQERERGREKEREKIAGNSGHRPAGKGRSLDLGLGLSWAPTKVREDALMSSFGRNISSGKKFRPKENELGKSQVASDVTEVFRGVLSEDGFATFKKYVHRFDAHTIPFDGPSGIVTRVEKLLDSAPSLDAEGKRDLLDRFIRILLQHA